MSAATRSSRDRTVIESSTDCGGGRGDALIGAGNAFCIGDGDYKSKERAVGSRRGVMLDSATTKNETMPLDGAYASTTTYSHLIAPGLAVAGLVWYAVLFSLGVLGCRTA